MSKIETNSTSLGNLFPEIEYDSNVGGKLSLDIWNSYRIRIDPISNSKDSYFMYTVSKADTLPLLSNTYYGTTRLWWLILLANDAVDPYDFLQDVIDGSEGENGQIKIYKRITVDRLLYDMQRNKVTQSSISKYNN